MNRKTFNPAAALASLLITFVCGSATAQTAEPEKGKVMKEGQVNEQSLIDALTPPVRTRSWRPGVAAAGTAGAAAPAPASATAKAKASILVTFVTGKADLTADAKKALDVLAGAMKSDKLASVKFTIEGHADPRGSEELNLKLSQARAESVRDYLTASHGMAVERVNAVGKGSSALMKPSEPAAPENRRVTIVAQQKE
jgi:OOP family OmpA-OmpF porin